MEGDAKISAMIEGIVPPPVWNEIRTILIQHEDSLHAVVGRRHDWIEEVTRAAVSRFKRGQVKVLPTVISHASALSFLVALMLFIPCAATVAVMKREMGSWKEGYGRGQTPGLALFVSYSSRQ